MADSTFVMLKPDAVERHLVYQVMRYFDRSGIFARCFDVQTATAQRMRLHYAEHIARFGPDFERKTLEMFAGRVVIPILLAGGPDVIADVRRIVGATEPAKAAKGTIRGDLGLGDSYAQSNAEDRLVRNLIHASDFPEAVRREAGIWLPDYSIG